MVTIENVNNNNAAYVYKFYLMFVGVYFEETGFFPGKEKKKLITK